jgi:CDP-diacylglycerol--glycerol-3-phosphate 3-phosphatidyltransferase
MTMSNETRGRVKGVFEPLALAMGRAGLTPNGLTLIGFAITVAGAVLLGAQVWLAGGIVMFAGGVFDMFDGTLARATGQVSKLGAFMDSVFDRWGEAVVYLGVAVGTSQGGLPLGASLAAAAMGAAFMVSYARAKAEGLGFVAGSGMAEVGLMPREVRLVVLAIGIVVAGVIGVPREDLSGGALALEAALAIIALLATVTVVQRILVVRRQAATLIAPGQGSSTPTRSGS